MGFQRLKRRVQKSKRPTKKIKEALAFSKAGLLRNHGQSSFPDLSALVTCNLDTRRDFRDRRGNSRYREASAFPDVSASVTCRVSFAKITGSLSKR
ncbi:hypothetical protein ACFX1T_046624 [Malus domestica]